MMKTAEVKKIIDETLKIESVIYTTPEPNEIHVNTNRWIIAPSELNEIISKGVKVYKVFAEGSSINLAIEDIQL